LAKFAEFPFHALRGIGARRMAGYFARPRSQRARTAAEGPSLARRTLQAPLEFLHADNLSRMFGGWRIC